jgi:hypothetical protein
VPIDANSQHLPDPNLPQPNKLIKQYIDSTALKPNTHITHTTIPTATTQNIASSNKQIYQQLQQYQSPLIIATDASYKTHDPPKLTNKHNATAAMVIIAIQNQQQNDTWRTKTTIPLVTRIHALPQATTQQNSSP